MASRLPKLRPRLLLTGLRLFLNFSIVFSSKSTSQDCSQKVNNGKTIGCKITQSCAIPSYGSDPQLLLPPSPYVPDEKQPVQFTPQSELNNSYLGLNFTFQINEQGEEASAELRGFRASLTAQDGTYAGSEECALFEFDSDVNLTQSILHDLVFNYTWIPVEPGSEYHLTLSSLPMPPPSAASPWEHTFTAASCNVYRELLYCNAKSAAEWKPWQMPIIHDNNNDTLTVEFERYPAKFNIGRYLILFGRMNSYSDCRPAVVKSPALVNTSCLDPGTYSVTVQADSPDCTPETCSVLAKEQLSISETTQPSVSTTGNPADSTTGSPANSGTGSKSSQVKNTVLSVLLVLIAVAIIAILFRIFRRREGRCCRLGLGGKDELRTANNADNVDTVPFCLNSTDNSAPAPAESGHRANGKPHIIYVPPAEGDKRLLPPPPSSGMAFRPKNSSPNQLAPHQPRGSSYKQFLNEADDSNEEEDLVGVGGPEVVTPLSGFSGERQDSGFQDDDCYSAGVMDAASNLSIGHHMTVPVDVHMPPKPHGPI